MNIERVFRRWRKYFEELVNEENEREEDGLGKVGDSGSPED